MIYKVHTSRGIEIVETKHNVVVKASKFMQGAMGMHREKLLYVFRKLNWKYEKETINENV